jgi:hypothetical protein
MEISDLLQGPMKHLIVSQIGQQLGINDTAQANTAVDGVIATLMNAVAHNVSTEEGANGLMSALDRDHDGSILNDITGFLTGAVQPQNPNTSNGAGILNHLLGSNQQAAAENISKSSGIDTGKIIQLMSFLAPIILGMLGKAKSQPQVQQGGGLLDFIKGATQTVNQQTSNQSIFTSLLDKNGNGSVVDDIAQMGIKSIFNKFFGRK